jgi:GNAT superfamily N-acetyltransferase
LSAYRFCRTDDIGLLVDALNRCWAPYFPGEPPMTPAAFKRSIRDLQVWCSSCMVAFAGPDPIGVLIGAKRPSGTLVLRIAVHPDHRRQGHGRHLLASLGSKLAILGPPRIVAEVPETLAPACGLFGASGYDQEALLTDYVSTGDANVLEAAAGMPEEHDGRFVIPVTVDDLAANGLLEEAGPQTCWERSVETLTARKDEIAGLAVASAECIEACVLYESRDVRAEANAEAAPPASRRSGDVELQRGLAGPRVAEAEPRGGAVTAQIVSLRSFVDDGGAGLKRLLSRLRAQGMGRLHLRKVHPAEPSGEWLQALGFIPAGRHRVYAARARAG